MWVNIEKVYYGCTIKDNALIRFRDEKFNKILSGRDKMPGFLEEIDRKECLELFNYYNQLNHELY